MSEKCQSPLLQRNSCGNKVLYFRNRGGCTISFSMNIAKNPLEGTVFVESEPEGSETFTEHFSRSYRLLHFIACRVLGSEEKAPIAIRNCWRTALCNPPHFEYEGAFRSWLVRILIDEALAIVRENKGNAAAAVVNAVSLSDSTVNRRA